MKTPRENEVGSALIQEGNWVSNRHVVYNPQYEGGYGVGQRKADLRLESKRRNVFVEIFAAVPFRPDYVRGRVDMRDSRTLTKGLHREDRVVHVICDDATFAMDHNPPTGKGSIQGKGRALVDWVHRVAASQKNTEVFFLPTHPTRQQYKAVANAISAIALD